VRERANGYQYVRQVAKPPASHTDNHYPHPGVYGFLKVG
jgi:hypothetical protein